MRPIQSLLVVTALWTSLLSQIVLADEAKALGLKNDSAAGIVVTSGNASTESLNFEQKNTYGWTTEDTLKFFGKYLFSSSNSVDTAQYWTLGLRYERGIIDRLSAYFGQAVESDLFSGYLQRYNSDVGGKYALISEDDLKWNAEAGYRYTIENRFAGQVDQNYLRFYTDVNKHWTKTASTQAAVEYLPNLTDTSDFQLNTDLAATAVLSEILSIKLDYLIKFRKEPPAPATKQTDSQFTTSLVASF